MRWAGHIASMEMRNEYKILVGNPEWKRPLGRPWHRWRKTLEWIFKEVGREGVDWNHLGFVAGFECNTSSYEVII
jgi:hypothetical protein